MTQSESDSQAQLNNVSTTAIGQTGLGQYYGILKGLSAAGQGMIPHKICRTKDGSSINVYDTTLNKVVGSFLTPTHEYVTKYIAQGNYGAALASSFGIFGQGKDVKAQEEADCTEIIPDEVIAQIEPKKVTKLAAFKTKATTTVKNPTFWIATMGVLLLTGLGVLAYRKIKHS